MEKFLVWYRDVFKTGLSALVEDGADSLHTEADKAYEMCRAASAWSDRFEVGFIGQSQIGKSTIINLLIGDKEFPQILPAGGVGPLTAQIIQLAYAEQRSFAVTYHQRDKINQMLFALEHLSDNPEEEIPDAKDKRGKILSEAKVLLTGDKDSIRDAAYLIRLLRGLVKKITAEDQEPFENGDRELYVVVQRALESGATGFRSDQTSRLFVDDLRRHAAGSLAPLVKTMDVGWPSELLKTGIVLYDLPGVGTFNDSLPECTQDWIRQKGKSVVLVMRQNGLDNEAVKTLRESGFLRRLLFSWDDAQEDPVQLILVVNQMDLLARERTYGGAEYNEAFREVCQLMEGRVRSSLSELLKDEIAQYDSEEVKRAKQQVAERLVNESQIIPLSAWEYRETFLANRKANFDRLEDSRVPELISAIRHADCRRKMELQKARNECLERLETKINLILEQLTLEFEERSDSRELLLQLRKDFKSHAETVRTELAARRGAFNEQVRGSIPEKIDGLINRVLLSATESFDSYCRSHKKTHWATLKAAIARGGCYEGRRKVDVQGEILKYIEEPIASSFSPSVIRPARDAASKLTEAYALAMKEIINWTKQHPEIPDNMQNQLSLIERKLKADQGEIEAVGQECIKELRERVREKLDKPVSKRINQQCEKFLASPDANGAGVKIRMLELMHDMGRETIRKGCEEAREFLRQVYQSVYSVMMQKEFTALTKDLVAEIEAVLFGVKAELRSSAAVNKKLKLLETLNGDFKQIRKNGGGNATV